MPDTDGINPAALKMAWKMVDTIFGRHSIPSSDRERLLNLLTAVSLEHLIDVATVRWTAPQPSAGSLRLHDQRVWIEAGSSTSLLKADFDEDELDRALDEAETLLDLYRLDEEEKATLFTALPCLGLSVLQQSCIRWQGAPPFAELG